MRLIVTADLHFNHPRSRAPAEDVIARIDRAGGDVLLVVGDTACGDGPHLEECLARFCWRGPRLFVCGNHELWTRRGTSRALFDQDLPRRVRALGWHWLEGDPFVAGDVAVVGTVGWYDYSFASDLLRIPRRFYEAKVSPRAAEYFGRDDLLADPSDIPPAAWEFAARWNDAKFVSLGRSDEAFLGERLAALERDLARLESVRHIVAATHHVPFARLLPQARRPGAPHRVEFVRAYLGSRRIGQVLLRFPNVRHLFCGHSHVSAETQVEQIRAVNLGSSYVDKRFEAVDLAA